MLYLTFTSILRNLQKSLGGFGRTKDSLELRELHILDILLSFGWRVRVAGLKSEHLCTAVMWDMVFCTTKGHNVFGTKPRVLCIPEGIHNMFTTVNSCYVLPLSLLFRCSFAYKIVTCSPLLFVV